ncbi:MAG TPA: hypothetical protein VNR40_00415, partial [Steroidobacter sp.]|nr:hypothetical protein [Steroidobacter sp.]
MSANFYGSFRSRQLRQRRALQQPGHFDLDSTADVHDEFTADLEPATVDIVPSDVPRPTLASSPQPRVPAEEPRPDSVTHDSESRDSALAKAARP